MDVAHVPYRQFNNQKLAIQVGKKPTKRPCPKKKKMAKKVMIKNIFETICLKKDNSGDHI